MNDDEIIRLSSNTNAAVVQLPERNQPGVVLQGDSLKNLEALLESAHKEIRLGNLSEAGDTINELLEIIRGYVESYDRATSLVERH